jgi:hypothetical protein
VPPTISTFTVINILFHRATRLHHHLNSNINTKRCVFNPNSCLGTVGKNFLTCRRHVEAWIDMITHILLSLLKLYIHLKWTLFFCLFIRKFQPKILIIIMVFLSIQNVVVGISTPDRPLGCHRCVLLIWGGFGVTCFVWRIICECDCMF